MKYLLLLATVCGLAILRAQAQCDKTVSVQVTRSGSVTLPYVEFVNLMTDLSDDVVWRGDGISDEMRQPNFTLSIIPPTMNINVSNGDTNYEFSLIIDEDTITCSNIVLPRAIETDTNYIFDCVPVSSCNNTNDTAISNIVWTRILNDTYSVTIDEDYDLPEDIKFNDMIDNVTRHSIKDVQNARLNILVTDSSTAGAYQAQTETGDILYTYILYYGPEFVQKSKTKKHETINVIFGTDDAENVELSCVFRSFPNSVVTWTRDYQSISGSNIEVFNVTDGSRYSNINNNIDPTYTINGGLTIVKAEYDDAGMYRCEASNTYETTTGEIRLRVRSPLRPLWPALGIILTLILTAVFIISGYLFDKIREEKNRGAIEQEDFNTAFQRPQSVVSYDEDKGTRRQSQRHLIPKT